MVAVTHRRVIAKILKILYIYSNEYYHVYE